MGLGLRLGLPLTCTKLILHVFLKKSGKNLTWVEGRGRVGVGYVGVGVWVRVEVGEG